MGKRKHSGPSLLLLTKSIHSYSIFLQLNWGLQGIFSIPSYKINEFLLKSSLNWTAVDRVTSTLSISLCELYVSCVKLQVDLFFEVSLAFLSKLLQYLANVLPVLENYLQNLLAKTILNGIFEENLLQCKLWCTSGVKTLTTSVCFVNVHTLIYFISKQMCTFTLNVDDTTMFIKIKTFIKLKINLWHKKWFLCFISLNNNPSKPVIHSNYKCSF